MPIRIFVADDHAVFRSGLKMLLEKEPDFEVVGEAGNGFDAIRAVKETDLDVLLLDVAMPGLSGARVAEEVLKCKPDLGIVVLTMHEDEYYLQEFFRLGVRAYVLKQSQSAGVAQAIRAAQKGNQYIDPSLADLVISPYVGRQSKKKKTQRLDIMTPRELQVLTLLAYGHTNAEIADKLCISERTVETHRNNIMTKMEFKSRAELVRFAIDNGILKLAAD
jgi:DNA-binding NarL/FixJ family response regulator